MEWTEERIAQLRTLWGEGLSAAKIADQMGEVTRSGVIGKAHRLGLEARESPIRSIKTPRPSGRPKMVLTPEQIDERKRKHAECVRRSRERNPTPPKPRAKHYAPRQPQVIMDPPDNAGSMTFMEAVTRKGCMYPCGKSNWCGMPRAHPMTSYCPEHHRVVWVAPGDKRAYLAAQKRMDNAVDRISKRYRDLGE